VSAVGKEASPAVAMPGDAITYTLTVVGSGQLLTLTDELPAQVSAPLVHSPALTYTSHHLSWTGSPDAGESIVLTYAVTIVTLSQGALQNQAVLTQAGGLTWSATSLVLVNPVQAYLPLVVKDGG